MASFRDLDEDRIISAAAKALTRATGRPVEITHVEPISDDQRRNLILRAVALSPEGTKDPIIIKATRSAAYDADASDILHSSGLVREWAATVLLRQQSADTLPVSRFLAGDAALGLIVLQDLGAELPTLVEPLLSTTPERAEAAILDYASTLGALHAQTVGCAQTYDQVIRAAFPKADIARSGSLSQLTHAADSLKAALGGQINEAELAAIAGKLDDPGPWHTLIHGDLCPDNILFKDNRACLIDFEFAQPGHALLDATYWSMGFPTCWCAGRLPAALAGQVEHAYRTALSATGAVEHDEQAYQVELAHVSVAQMLRRTSWHLDKVMAEDNNWGIASIRDRILWWLHSSCVAMDRADTLPGIRTLAESWLTELQNRWRSNTFLDYYPAFRSPDGQES